MVGFIFIPYENGYVSLRRNTMEFKEPIKVPDYVLVGDEYLTYGGWKVRIVYITKNRYYAHAIHRPDTQEESTPATHRGDGSYDYISWEGDEKIDYFKNRNILFDQKVSN